MIGEPDNAKRHRDGERRPGRQGCRLHARVFRGLAVLALAAAPAAAQGKIRAVRGIGSERFTSAEIARASGLRAGEDYSPAAMRAAQRRLAETGAFSEVSVTEVPANGDHIVDFGVTDAKLFVPVRFLRFTGFDNRQIQAALAGIPLYHGSVPLLRTGLIREVQRALQSLLRAHHLPGRVGYGVEVAQVGAPAESVVFHVERP